jgi:hypothetical protein
MRITVGMSRTDWWFITIMPASSVFTVPRRS